MNKVYIIRFEDYYSGDGEYSSGVSYIFDTLEKAKQMLNVIEADEINHLIENGYEDVSSMIKEYENGFMIDWADDYSKFEIVEMEVK